MSENVDQQMLMMMCEQVAILKSSNDIDAVKEAFDKITEPCTDPKTFEQALDALLLVKDCCTIILNAVKTWHTNGLDPYGNVVSQGLSTMHNTSLHADIAVQYLANGAYEFVIDCMNTYPDHENVQIRGSGTIGSMVVHCENRDDMLTKIQHCEASIVVARAMSKHPQNPKLHRWAYKTLDRMTALTELRSYYMDTGLLVEVATSYDRIRRLETNEYTKDIHKFVWSILMHLKPDD